STFNAMGKTKIIMKVSVLMNVINVVGNYFGIFVFHMGVLGVAVPTLLGRMVAALVMVIALRHRGNPIRLCRESFFPLSLPVVALIVSVSIPGALENFLFHFSKVAISSIVSTFGTNAIASYGAAGNFWSMASICSMAMGRCFVTVIGQCTGSGDKEATSFYFRYLIRLSFFLAILWNAVLFSLSPLILSGFALESGTKILTLEIIFIHNGFYALLCTYNSALPNGLRAAGDIKWVMGASIFSTVVCRLFFSWLFGIVLGMGVVGITLAMVADWSVKSMFVFFRYRSGAWQKKKLV
ncbi:MAG: MATE family efflux transporter, partial [Candidatus Ornithospirochaeta sp.]